MRLPRTRATTAYNVLKFVRKVILEEPKRLRMGIWGGRADCVVEDPRQRPECGTVGCLAGWTNVVTGQHKRWGFSWSRAAWVLGLLEDQHETLFTPETLCSANNQGTHQHARDTVKHLDTFMRQHEAQLKAHRIDSVTNPA